MADEEEKRTASVGLRLRPRTREALEQLAKADKRKLAPYIEIVLEEHVASKQSVATKSGKRR